MSSGAPGNVVMTKCKGTRRHGVSALFPTHRAPHWTTNACKLPCRVRCPQNTHHLLRYSKYSRYKLLGVDSWRLWVVACESMELFVLLNSAVWCVVLYGDWCRLLQTTLERHVNGHFNQSEAGNGNAGARRSLESASSKLFRRNGKKLRYRRQPWSGRACALVQSISYSPITCMKLVQNCPLMAQWMMHL